MEVEDQEFHTKNGKSIKIYNVKGTGLFCIAFASGGELPKELSGMYTSPSKAKAKIERYIETQKVDKRYSKNKKDTPADGETAEQNSG